MSLGWSLLLSGIQFLNLKLMCFKLVRGGTSILIQEKIFYT